MESAYFLKVIDRTIAFLVEHEGHSVGEPLTDGTIQANFPLVGMRILNPDGTVENRPDESWGHEPTTFNPIYLEAV